MDFYVSLKKGQSFTVQGPVSGRMYVFKRGQPLLVHPGDYDVFKIQMDRFDAYHGDQKEWPDTRKTHPKSHRTVREMTRGGGPSIQAMQDIAMKQQKIEEQSAKDRRANQRLLARKAYEQKIAQKIAEEDRRNADAALNAQTPLDAVAALESHAKADEVSSGPIPDVPLKEKSEKKGKPGRPKKTKRGRPKKIKDDQK